MSYHTWRNLNPFELHKALINEYILTTKASLSLLKRDTSKDKTDFDVIRENHKFLWDEKDEKNLDTWEKRLAKKYYDKLYREYCIADLSRYKENKFGLRWRTEEELVNGRGQFTCGNKKCVNNEELRTWEVNFAYQEAGEKKNALVKLRLCPGCSHKLNYCHKKKEVKKPKKKHRDREKPSSSKHVKTEKPDKSVDEDKSKDNAKDETEIDEKEDVDIWKAKDNPEEEKSRDEEFEEYLEDLFL
ncbi:UNVERIFIED_CONTAM: hypothetical protein PYX00_007533 [Menopon gallinae]|uniref:Protein FRA10AC1 n=1 Tax=Menopon gallinae TaxID=328185 RepID=A0AAW2HJI4_9NEOP